jgi:hypothetical protein
MDPQETLDFTIDFTAQLNAAEPADVISDATWRIDSRNTGLNILSETLTATAATVLVEGNVKSGQRFRLVCTAVTVGGRRMERSILVEMIDK